MWRHLIPHDAPWPWQWSAMVGRFGFHDGRQQVMVVHGISGLLANCLCVGLVAYVLGRAGLP